MPRARPDLRQSCRWLKSPAPAAIANPPDTDYWLGVSRASDHNLSEPWTQRHGDKPEPACPQCNPFFLAIAASRSIDHVLEASEGSDRTPAQHRRDCADAGSLHELGL